LAALRIDLVGTTANFRRFRSPQPLPINHLLGENCGTQGRIGEVGLTFADIERYELAADFTTASDTQSAAFVAKWGDVSVELDALPIEVLRGRIVSEIESRMDLDALERARATEVEERHHLIRALEAVGGHR
jgi:hypothetical protein